MEENLSIGSLIGDPGSTNAERAPFLNELARTCGLATNYRAVTQPSHPNYIAAVAGDTYVPPSCARFSCTNPSLDRPSIFSQLENAGRSWRMYVESMSSPCRLGSSELYEAGHNSAIWFPPLRRSCIRNDVGVEQLGRDLQADGLPSFAWIVPNEHHNMHTSAGGGDGKIRAADTWIRPLMARLVASYDYADGSTVVFVTWDEGDLTGAPFNRDCLSPALADDVSCQVATIVASRWVEPGIRSEVPLSHFGLLKTSERLLGVPLLAHAGDPDTADMIEPFGLEPTG